jgi:hypothetical protein
MDSNFRFLVARPSNRHGRSDCFLETWSGSVGEPEIRIHLPPAGSQANSGVAIGDVGIRYRRRSGLARLALRGRFGSAVLGAGPPFLLSLPNVTAAMPQQIYVDGDACPVREEIYRVATRSFL